MGHDVKEFYDIFAEEYARLYFNELEKRLPLQKLASAEDVINAILFLFGNDSITGQTIVVDGGEHLL